MFCTALLFGATVRIRTGSTVQRSDREVTVSLRVRTGARQCVLWSHPPHPHHKPFLLRLRLSALLRNGPSNVVPPRQKTEGAATTEPRGVGPSLARNSLASLPINGDQSLCVPLPRRSPRVPATEAVEQEKGAGGSFDGLSSTFRSFQADRFPSRCLVQDGVFGHSVQVITFFIYDTAC